MFALGRSLRLTGEREGGGSREAGQFPAGRVDMQGDWVRYAAQDGRVYFASQAEQRSAWERPVVRSMEAEEGGVGVVSLTCGVVSIHGNEKETTGVHLWSPDGQESSQPSLFPRVLGEPGDKEEGTLSRIVSACQLVAEGEEYLVCAVESTSSTSAMQKTLLTVTNVASEEAASVFVLASYRQIALAGLDGLLYLGSQRGVVEVYDVVGQGMEEPLKRLCMGENLAAGIASSSYSHSSHLSLCGIGVSWMSVHGKSVLVGDINGTVRFVEQQALCFPPLGVDCGKKYGGEIAGMGVREDYLFVAKGDAVFVYQWSQMHTVMANCLGRVPPKHICKFSLGSDLSSTITSLVCYGERTFTGQKDGTIAVWRSPTEEEDEYEYEVEEGEEEEFPGPEERFLVFPEGVIKLCVTESGLWAVSEATGEVKLLTRA